MPVSKTRKRPNSLTRRVETRTAPPGPPVVPLLVAIEIGLEEVRKLEERMAAGEDLAHEHLLMRAGVLGLMEARTLLEGRPSLTGGAV